MFLTDCTPPTSQAVLGGKACSALHTVRFDFFSPDQVNPATNNLKLSDSKPFIFPSRGKHRHLSTFFCGYFFYLFISNS